MRINYITNALGIIMLYFGIVILTPIIVAIIDKDYFSVIPFLAASLFSIGMGFLLKHNSNNVDQFNDLKRSEGLFIVVLTWTIVAIITGIPYLFYGLSPINAFFEAVSGITGTGSTILTDFSLYPNTFFFWRSLSQWLGGLGILVLFIAVLPQFAVAGRQLFFAESPGPTEDKLTPRITHTAKALWAIYVFLTVLEIIMLKLAGMPLFDAFCNSFSTLSAGGFSPNPESIQGYNSPIIDWIVIAFMFLAGINFSLQYRFIVTRKISLLFQNEEFKTYLFIILISGITLTSLLVVNGYYLLFESIRHAVFQLMSILSCTGFASQDFELWDSQSKLILLFLMLIGGSAGSAAGAIKIVRLVLIGKFMIREIKQTLHPSAVYSIKLDSQSVKPDVLKSVIGFIMFYLAIFFLSSIIVSFLENSIIIGFSGSAATMGGVGPGFSLIGPFGTFDKLTNITKLIFCFDMLIGRLELIPFLVMLNPDFWNFKSLSKK